MATLIAARVPTEVPPWDCPASFASAASAAVEVGAAGVEPMVLSTIAGSGAGDQPAIRGQAWPVMAMEATAALDEATLPALSWAETAGG